jgi:hypothetical protein
LAVGIVPFAGVPFRERLQSFCVCRLNPASSVNTQFRVKSRSGVDSHSSTFSFLSLSTQSPFLATGNLELSQCYLKLLHKVPVQSR